jgi:hypothetical protein
MKVVAQADSKASETFDVLKLQTAGYGRLDRLVLFKAFV